MFPMFESPRPSFWSTTKSWTPQLPSGPVDFRFWNHLTPTYHLPNGKGDKGEAVPHLDLLIMLILVPKWFSTGLQTATKKHQYRDSTHISIVSLPPWGFAKMNRCCGVSLWEISESQNTEMRRKHKKTRSAEIWDLLRFAEILLADLKVSPIKRIFFFKKR